MPNPYNTCPTCGSLRKLTQCEALTADGHYADAHRCENKVTTAKFRGHHFCASHLRLAREGRVKIWNVRRRKVAA